MGRKLTKRKKIVLGIWLTVSFYSTMQCFVRLGPTILGGKIGERRREALKRSISDEWSTGDS